MALRVVGAGLGRTGTHSLKVALEQLLGAPCYHMIEVIQHPESIAEWQALLDGTPPDWDALMAGYAAAVDWPVCAYWRELADAYPDAIVLLSTRSSAAAWWKSANDTIFEVGRREAPPIAELQQHLAWVRALLTQRFTPDWNDPDAAQRAYEAHNASVRAAIAPERLVDWQPGDGWEPICRALGVDLPDTPFPHVNSTDEFRAMAHLDD